MQARGKWVRPDAGALTTTMATLLASLAALAPAAAQDSGRIRITLTVPQQIHARVYAARPASEDRSICVVSTESVAFSVSALSIRPGSWRLLRLPLAAPESAGACQAGMTVSIRARSGAVTLVLSPE